MGARTAVRRIVIAPDSFKGSISSPGAAAELAAGWRQQRPQDEVRCCPLADGGEGTLEALRSAVPGAQARLPVPVSGPDGRPAEAGWLALPDATAVVELATAAGLDQAPGTDPVLATTYGVGELLGAALRAGAEHLVLTVGGSATTDGGSGAAQALGARLTGTDGRDVAPRGALCRVAAVDLSAMPPPARGMTILTDVTNPLCGPTGAAAIYGPQKGADARQIEQLDAALRRWAGLLGIDPNIAGLGAAGGTPAPFVAAWQARMTSGLGYVADATGLDGLLAGADLVITGEGRFDETSLAGKVCGEVARRAGVHGVPVAVVAGSVGAEVPARVRAVALADLAGSAGAAIRNPRLWLRRAGVRLAAEAC